MCSVYWIEVVSKFPIVHENCFQRFFSARQSITLFLLFKNEWILLISCVSQVLIDTVVLMFMCLRQCLTRYWKSMPLKAAPTIPTENPHTVMWRIQFLSIRHHRPVHMRSDQINAKTRRRYTYFNSKYLLSLWNIPDNPTLKDMWWWYNWTSKWIRGKTATYFI